MYKLYNRCKSNKSDELLRFKFNNLSVYSEYRMRKTPELYYLESF